jgi:tripartite-type tricarboxylate transporter receptor subunit TctC
VRAPDRLRVKDRAKMPLVRTIGFAGACLGALASISPTQLQAQEWPTRPVKIVVAFAPGGSADQLGRLFAAELSTAFRQQFYVENKPGNSGSIGSSQVARAEPDGYSLLVAGSGPHLTGPAINPNIGYDPLKDFTHIAMIAADSYVLAANPALGAGSIAARVELARSKPLTSSSPGAGSLGHLILEQFKRRAGVDIQHVPAPNSGMLDVLGNHISMSFTTLLTAGEHIRSGGMVALAVTSSERNPVYRTIPTFAEQGYPDVRGETWFWLAGPRNLPPASSTSSMRRSAAS